MPVESLQYWSTILGESGFVHALQSGREGFYMTDFTSHQKLEGVDGALIVSEIDETLINEFRSRFCHGDRHRVNSLF